MVALSTLLLSATSMASLALAAPTQASTYSPKPYSSSDYNTPTPAHAATGATHTVVAGRAGQLIFDPENVVAEIGDIIEYHYLPKNHSVVQSSFDEPCKPLADGSGFFSGFMPTTPEQGQNPNVFSVTVTDKKPIWFYCSQTVGNHCQMGMAGVVNQNFDGPNTLAAYKKKAAGTGVSVSPPYIQGGVVKPNPNPTSGV